MRKKFTMLLAALLLGLGATNAQVTKYYKPGERKATFTAGDKVMFYNTALVLNGERTGISQDRTGFLIGTTSFVLDKQKPKNAPIFSEKVGVFTVETVDDQSTYYKVNVRGANGYVGIGGVVNNADASALCFHKWTTVADNKKTGDDVASENATGEGFVKRTEITDSHNLWIVANDGMGTLWNGNQETFTTWSTGHPYAIYSVVEATTAELEELLAQAKTTAKATLDELAKMPLYTVGTAADEVDAVVMVDDDLETALNTIDAIVINVKKTIDGKNVTFQNHGSGGRDGRFLGYDKGNSRAATVVKYDNNGDEVIWTMKACDDGTFKLYNFANNLYLGAPGSAATHVEEASAPSFRFAASTSATYPSTFALVCSNGQWVHVENNASNNYKLMSYQSTTDGASLWTISEVGEIHITRDNYNAKSTVLNDLMAYAKQLQDEVGLVANGEKVKVVVNHPSGGDSQPSSNLLDGNNSSFVHSSYNTDMVDGEMSEGHRDQVENHYIEVELSKATRNIFCYFSKRNNNNRPAVIKVLAGNSAENITTEVATLTMGESYDGNVQSYFSKGIDLGAEYTHLRFVVTKTNTGSKFFTLSEFYVLPIDEETQNISNLTSASITDADINTKVAAAQSYLKGFLFADVYDVLQANKDKHAAIPALGQYPTAAYEALEAAFNDDAATQETLEAAVTKFEKSLNKPVYIITSAWDAGYPAGAAIYYDGAWKWKKANRYDKQMWMTLPGYTEAAVPEAVDAYDANNPSYGFCDYLTGTKMRGKDVQIVAIPGWGKAFNLQYNADGTSTDAAQHADQYNKIVNWKAATMTECQASAWQVEYIGNTYDLDQLVDEQLQALTGLQNAFDSKVYLFDAVVGDGIGQYKDDNGTLSTMLQDLFDMIPILNEDLSNLNDLKMTIDEINATAAQFNSFTVEANMPEDGKYYRIYGANQVIPQGYYITGHTNSDGGRIALTAEADASTIYYYKDTHLQAYQSGNYIGLTKDHYTFATSKDDQALPASVITFAASPRVAGAYTIKSADRYLHYKSISETEVEIDRCGSDEALRHDWYLMEVEKQTITYIYKAGETELARQTVTEFAGMPYPASNVTLPWGYTVPTDALTGNIPVGETEKVIACELDASLIPFQYANSYEAIETNGYWYYLKFDSDNNYYLHHVENQDHIALDSKAVDKKNKDVYSWGFVGDPINGFKIVNKAAGSTKILSSSTTMAGETGAGTWPIMTVAEGLAEGNNTYWIPTASTHATNGFFLAQKGFPSNRLNNRNSKLAYWTGGTGSGSTFVVEARPFGPAAELEELLIEAEELKAVVDANTGDKIGEYSSATATALATAIETAKAVTEATAADVTDLENVVLGTKINLPTVGTYYQIRSSLAAFSETKAAYSNDGTPSWKTLSEYDKSFYWLAVETANGGIALQNAIDNKYLTGAAHNIDWTLANEISEAAELGVKIFSKENPKGYEYGVILNGYQMHAMSHGNGNGTNGTLRSYDTNSANSASSWFIVEAELPSFYPVTYKFNYNGDTKYTQEKLVAVGGAYPEMDLFLPYGVTSDFELPAGTVQAVSDHEFELTVNKALPFEAVAEGNTPSKWYYAQMHANALYTAYVGDDEGLTWWNNTHVETEDTENYLWGFVGDLWTGYKMVNKATGRAIQSTGSGDATLVDAASATKFILSNSNVEDSEWFCLKYPGNENYLNANAGDGHQKIEHWTDNDHGSSIFLTESGKSYPLNMETTGYATFYSQYRVAIPEGVEAWVVSSIENNEVVLDEVDGDILPANTGVILKGTGTPSIVTSAAATATVGTNLLRGTVTKTLIEAAANTSYYVLAKGVNGVKLYKALVNKNAEGTDGNTHFYNNANKVYLPVETPVVEENGEPAQALAFRFRGKEQGTTEIEVPATNDQQPAVIYDLTGRRIEKIVEKGIYIVNGKKVVIK